MSKLIIEARVNEYMMRERGNPHVPYTPDENCGKRDRLPGSGSLDRSFPRA